MDMALDSQSSTLITASFDGFVKVGPVVKVESLLLMIPSRKCEAGLIL